MQDELKTKKQLIDDMRAMRQKIAQLESLEKQSLQQPSPAEAAITTCTNAIASMNLDGYLTYANPFFLRTWGYSDQNEIMGRYLTSLFKDEEQTRKTIRRVLSGREIKDVEAVAKRKDGSEFLAGLNSSMIRGTGRKPKGITISATDITGHKQLEDLLMNIRSSLNEAQHVAHMGNWDWDLANNTINWSDEIYHIFGLEPKELNITHDTFINSVHPDDKRVVQEALDKSLYNKKSYNVHYRIILPDSSERLIHERANVKFDDNGKPVRMAGIIQDITEQKCIAEQIKACSNQLARATEGTTRAIASITEMRDPYTAGHQKRVSQLACAIAEAQGLAKEQIQGIRVAGYLHDVGKICVPAEILSKSGRLNKMEFGMIKHHTDVGYNILKPVEFPWPISKIVFQHHERLNGTGYPQKLHDKDILIESKILAVADVVEAISTHRPYRPSLGIQAALEEISNNRAVLYDAGVVDACTQVLNGSGFQFEYN